MKNLILIIITLVIIDLCNAQQFEVTNMKNIDFQYNLQPSFESKIIQSIMGLSGMKKKMEKKMISSSFAKNPAKLPKSLFRNFNIEEIEQNGRKVWTISSKDSISDIVILYLHGGAYMGNITKQHWDLIELLIIKTNATIIIPDYPLAPEATYNETYNFIEELYTKLTTDYPSKRIVFIGDSAGGGLALGFAQQLKNENKKQPDEIIIFSPWLDITMSNPDIQMFEKYDKLLSIEGLQSAGKKYAGTIDLTDYRVSPIYGDFTGMCRISIFIGTNDILFADAKKCKQLLLDQNIRFNYFEYPKMFHDWVIITSLKESQDVINKVSKLIN